MLIFTRKVHESIIINGNIEVILYRTAGLYARIGIDAPRDITVNRKEIHEKILKKLADEAKNTNINIMKL